MDEEITPSFKLLLNLQEAVEQMMEPTRALVAAFKADGFTDREARMIVAGLLGPKNDPENEWKDPTDG